VNKNEIKTRRTKIDDVFSLSIKSALLSLIAKRRRGNKTNGTAKLQI
jgi:hypothetical protein